MANRRKRKPKPIPQEVRWKRSSRAVSSRPDAAIAYVEIERIADEHGGKATADAVLEESKPKDAPLHECFEWSNKAASRKWRLHQAREIINSIEVTLLEEDPNEDGEDKHLATAPAFVSIERDQEDGGYRSITTVMDNPELKDRLIQQALRELQSWTKRYEHLTEFASVHAVIRGTKKPKAKTR